MKDPSIGEEIEIILNSSPAIIFLWKAREDWPVDFVTDNIIQFGYSKNEFLSGKLNYADIVHPDDVDRVKKSYTDIPEKVNIKDSLRNTESLQSSGIYAGLMKEH